MVEHVGDALLCALAVVCATWARLLSALCIGDSCPESLRVRWGAWLAIAGALGGAALVFRPRTRALGRLLLTVPIVVAVAVTFTGP